MSLSARDREIKQALVTANRRLDKIEKEDIRNSGAYRVVQKDFINQDKWKSSIFKQNTGKEKPRFRTDVSRMTEQEKKMALSRARTFNESRTSTITGIKDIYEKSKKNLESSTDFEIDYDTYIAMWDEEITKELVSMYGSQQANILVKEIVGKKMTNQELNDFWTRHKGDDIDSLYSALGIGESERVSYKHNKTFYSSGVRNEYME